jgi:hypothetical protein
MWKMADMLIGVLLDMSVPIDVKVEVVQND